MGVLPLELLEDLSPSFFRRSSVTSSNESLAATEGPVTIAAATLARPRPSMFKS